MTSAALANIEREGIYRQFPRIPTYLRQYKPFGPLEENDDLGRLKRYAVEGAGFPYTYYQGATPEGSYNAVHAEMDMSRFAAELYRHAIPKALTNEPDWLEAYARATAYDYWAARMNLLRTRDTYAAAHIDGRLSEYYERLVPDMLPYLVPAIVDCLALGWELWALRLARDVLWAIEKQLIGEPERRHAHLCILQMIADWQGWDGPKLARAARADPLYELLVAHWAAPSVEDVSRLILAACDRHTHQARPDSSKADYDFPLSGLKYRPYVALTIMKMRELRGLAIPQLDHVLLNTNLGKLTAPLAEYTDDLLNGVIGHARKVYPGL